MEESKRERSMEQIIITEEKVREYISSQKDAKIGIDGSKMEQMVKDLNTLGYAIIEDVFGEQETDILRKRLWKEYIEKVFLGVNFEDKTTWKEYFPYINAYGIFSGSVCQTQVLWDIRMNRKLKSLFSHIWNTKELSVSMDGCCLMCPNNIRPSPIYNRPWPHVDQYVSELNTPPEGFKSESTLETEPYTIQGQVLLTDSLTDNRGFWCYPKSHLEPQETIFGFTLCMNEDEKNRYTGNKFKNPTKLKAKKGSVILWDSRLFHWNRWANDEDEIEDPDIERMVTYVCYTPKSRSSNIQKYYKRDIIMSRLGTTHNPNIFCSIDNSYIKGSINRESDYLIPFPVVDSSLL